MKRSRKHLLAVGLLAILAFFSCRNQSESTPDTILTGNASVWVDESIMPIVEDEQAVFESQYKGRLRLQAATETAIIQSLIKGQGPKIALITRPLSVQEQKAIKAHDVKPKVTLWGYDGLALIVSKTTKDTLISWQELKTLLIKGKGPHFKGLVFDNINSSTARTLQEVLQVSRSTQVYSMHNHREVVDYIAQHPGFVGVVGVNWMMQPPIELYEQLQGLRTLYVENPKEKAYFYPSQDAMASTQYLLMRPLYLINVQGYAGLGKGFAAFIAGERGQRILLKSGLVPEHYPSRKLVVRPQIHTKNEE